MQRRTIGDDAIPAVGVGALSVAGRYGAADDAESIALIRHALDIGCTHIDTAESYGNGRSETVVGQAIAGRRDEVFLATKFAIDGPGGSNEGKGSPAEARKSLEGSLRRLGVDYVDLYYLHRVDPRTPIEVSVGAMADFVNEGKVRYLGLSEVSPATLRRAQAVHPIQALQTEYSMFSREPEREILDTVRELGLTFIAYSPLGRGMLTGRIGRGATFSEGDPRPAMPWFQGTNLARNVSIVEQLADVAEALGISPAQLALAWVLAQGDDIATIPGTRQIARLDENVAAGEIELSPEVRGQIDGILHDSSVAGDRYHAGGMKQVNR